ncbi:DNA polymerase III subunit gamma/tau [Rufibacter glacialis]|uniref:DNA polymerase III subunit gamma/tau n=1 Tax=Rufibacter glacialis TaxID=1259555 RepID=A0A5M8QGX2_9BACT|nr:DNA polymerase III subunit gamma/tau [Rufibacter glacialis]KAA6435305.1 DNA polymerase III subunit gamma/tau [Rufibacter glacialis]GGK62178.1 DNA polymerase III subunit gamma/tau [Rufibacter glacialis]
MENFVVSARKYRPATFDSVVGQHHITTTLKNAISSNHLAQAFLFCGPRGVGKTTCARILAKTINCQNITPQVEACNECDSCRSFNNNSSFNVHELDAASNNSVEDIRNLVEQVRYAPQTGKYKIYIIDEVHMLSNSAFNAFLKTLEEPPAYAIFILATTERHKIIPTILSRCQIFDFNRIRIEDMVQHLGRIAQKEEIKADDDALHLISQKADGALRDALSIFDQMVTFSGHHLTYKATVQNLHILDYDYYFRLTEYLLTQNLSGALLLYDEILKNGFDSHNFVLGIGEHFRSLLVCKDQVTVQLLQVSENIKVRYAQQAQEASLSFLLSGLNLVGSCDQNFKAAKNQRLHVELLLMKLAHLPHALQLASDVSLMGDVKKKTNGSSSVAAANSTAPAMAPPAAAPAPAPAIAPSAAHVSASFAKNEPETHHNTAPADMDAGQDPVFDTYPEEAPSPVPSMAPPLPAPAPAAPAAPLRTVSSPLASRKLSKLPSLKNIEEQVAASAAPMVEVLEEETENYVPGSLPPINEHKLQQLWKLYVDRIKHTDRTLEYTILNREWYFDAEKAEVHLQVENEVQVAEFNSFKPEFLMYLRQGMGHNRLQVHIDVVQQENSRKLYTSQDKYNYLADMYPVLKDLKNRLGLDTDF